jgi:hypothetical protein
MNRRCASSYCTRKNPRAIAWEQRWSIRADGCVHSVPVPVKVYATGEWTGRASNLLHEGFPSCDRPKRTPVHSCSMCVCSGGWVWWVSVTGAYQLAAHQQMHCVLTGVFVTRRHVACASPIPPLRSSESPHVVAPPLSSCQPREESAWHRLQWVLGESEAGERGEQRAPWGTPVSYAFCRSISACSGVGLYIGSHTAPRPRRSLFRQHPSTQLPAITPPASRVYHVYCIHTGCGSQRP